MDVLLIRNKNKLSDFGEQQVLKLEETKIAIIGMGYVGLPLAVEFAKNLPVTLLGIISCKSGNHPVNPNAFAVARNNVATKITAKHALADQCSTLLQEFFAQQLLGARKIILVKLDS